MTGRATALARARVLRECLLHAGAPEVSIELQPGRPAPGDIWNACYPIATTSHHIASRPTPANPTPGLSLVKKGRGGPSPLEGPLANGTAGVDLVYRIICMGLANHPGEGGPLTVRGPLGAYTIPKDLGRPYLWGTEYEGGYDDETWDRVYTNKRTGISMSFREFMGRSNAGLAYGIWLINGKGKKPDWSMDLSGYTMEHKTWAPGRKPDRLNYSTESGRAEVRRYNDGGDDVAAKDVWDFVLDRRDKVGSKMKAGVMLAQAHNRAGRAEAKAEAALRQAKANREAIRQVAGNMTDTIAAQRVIDALGPDVDERENVILDDDEV